MCVFLGGVGTPCIMYIATSATICIYVYVCNSLVCHSFDFKRIKLCLSVCLSVMGHCTTGHVIINMDA